MGVYSSKFIHSSNVLLRWKYCSATILEITVRSSLDSKGWLFLWSSYQSFFYVRN